MDAILLPVGSAGDVHPFVGLGQVLAARGHQVTLVTNTYFRNLVERAGLTFVPLGPDDFQEQLRDPRLWHPLHGFKAVMQAAVLPLVRPMYELLAQRYQPGRTLVVGASLALGARVAQEKLGLPLATLHLQPVAFRSLYKPARVPRLFMPAWLPRPVKAFQFWLADRLVVDRVIGPVVNGLRTDLGLPRVRGFVRDWWHSPELTLGMFPAWYAPPQPDWPPATHLVGFPFYDERDVTEPPGDLVQFLERGEPPLAFTPGSAMLHGGDFFAAAVEACLLLGRRGILLTRFAEQIPQALPDQVRYIPFAPFSWLLPRCAALVHHGGIGTLSQGLAAGVPQVIMPMSHDQPDNGDRLVQLGVGSVLARRRFRGPALANALSRLLNSVTVANCCREVAARFAGVNGLARAADLIEGLHQGRLPAPASGSASTG